MDRKYTRRRFIEKYFFITAVGTGGMAVACNEKQRGKKNAKTTATVDTCNDFSGVTENDRKAREKLGYVNESPIPDMTCSLCNLWLPPNADKKCGGCMLFKGPVYATGYCTYWAPRQG